MRILVVASLPMEFSSILSHAQAVEKPRLPVDWVRSANIREHEFLLLANGATRRRAGAALDAVWDAFRPQALVSTGFCGAAAPELGIADVVVATEVAWDGQRFPALPVTGARAHRGLVRTLDHIAGSREERASLRAAGAMAVEMEAAEPAERASLAGLPFYCIKTVTDLAHETLANDFNGALRSDGHFATIVVLREALRHPLARIPELFRLRRRCARAARVLGDFFADCRF
jgi:nucleoside phosphorylase